MPPIQQFRPWLLPIGVMACLVVILMPLPTAVMDLLLAGNVALAVVILLTTIHVRTPLEFSVFPTLLLATTLSRLVLNIATTRLILTGAPTLGDNAAGGVVRSFGQFVAGNQLEVGLVIFLILVVVQFVVITKGATRISEVAARFSLDGMPGRQSAIEADLSAGILSNEEATAARQSLIDESDFFAAMDGASKFVRGDAVAGLIITVINILGGLYLGIVVSGMDIGQAASVFTKLTIGDGLVSQLPSLLISLSAGVLVTRGSRPTDLADNFISQLLGNSNALFVAGGFLLLLMFTGLPIVPLLLLGTGSILIASTLFRGEQRESEAEIERQEAQETATANQQKRVEDFLSVDPLEVAIGLGLLPLADPSRGGDLMQRISGLRNQMAAEVGIVLPKVRVRDDAMLGDQQYEVRLFGDLIAKRSVHLDHLLAIGDHRTTGKLDGLPANDLSIAHHAVWIHPDQREQAMIYGYQTHTASDVLADHLERIARAHADELLSRDATKHLLDELQRIAPAMVDELVPGVMNVSDIQKVLQGLLREGIPIRQLGIILESLSDAARVTQETDEQIEHVRRRLSRMLCAGLRDSNRVIHAVALSDSLSRTFSTPQEPTSEYSQDITCDAIRKGVKNLIERGYPAIVLVEPGIRSQVKQTLSDAAIECHVLSTAEITPDTQIKILTTATDRQASVAA